MELRRPSPMPRAWIVVVGFLLAGILGLGAYFLPVFQTAANSTIGSGSIPDINPVTTPTQPFTVLLLGSDDDAKFPADRVNTQSMILMRVDPSTKQATMLSIPRDLWVPIPNQGMGKISTAYQLGGSKAAIAAVESNFKVHVDDYVWIGLNGLVKLIDQIGGVNLFVTNPVMDDFYPMDLSPTGNPYDYYRVAVLPGSAHLDGVRALQYVRSRHGDLREDFGRSERQQQVLLALRTRAHSVSLTDLPDIASALKGEILTDMSLTEVADLLPIAAGLQLGNVERVLLLPPYTHDATVDGQSVLEPDWDRIHARVAQSFP